MLPVATELAAEDALRLAVLLAGDLLAARLDEGSDTLYALTGRGEARIALHPGRRRDRYFNAVRERLAGHALGAPGGYPAHLRQWMRMGQASATRLEALLKLGESEAVAAVAHARNLTDELARRAWWAAPGGDIARVMLQHEAVRVGEMGRVLTDYLLEDLPFEADPVVAMHSVRALVSGGRLDADAAAALWAKAQRRPHLLIGFLEFGGAALPDTGVPRVVPDGLPDAWAQALAREFSGQGQAWLRALRLALDKPPAHEAVYRLFDLLTARFAPLAGLPPPPALTGTHPAEAAALVALAATDAAAVTAILAGTTAVGPQLRRKLAPAIDPLLAHLAALAP